MQVPGGFFHLLLPASRAVHRLISILFSCILLSLLTTSTGTSSSSINIICRHCQCVVIFTFFNSSSLLSKARRWTKTNALVAVDVSVC
jgi:hypothetical protein